MRHSLIVFLLLVVSVACLGQGYMPMGKPAGTAFAGPSDSQVCATSDIPTRESLKTKKFETRTAIVSGSQVAKANIAWFNGSVNLNQLYAISDSGRFAPCTAKDGKTTVYYGQVVRMVVQMNDYKVEGSASIAIVAASATVNGKSNSVDLYEVGYGSGELDQKLVKAKGLVSGSGINIDNYSKFMDAVQDAQVFAVGLPEPGIDVVGYEPASETLDRSIAMAWGVRQVYEGRGCLDAQRRYRKNDSVSLDAIRDVYQSLTGGCGAVEENHKQEAKKLLADLKINY